MTGWAKDEQAACSKCAGGYADAEGDCVPVCDSSCGDHGSCTAPNTCTCSSAEWSGDLCDVPVCEASCQNEGTCVRPNECSCTEQWTGSVCELPVCVEACVHGTCSAPNTCSCDNGWEGSVCDIAICEISCGDHGSCSEPNTCTCLSGWKGDACDAYFPVPGQVDRDFEKFEDLDADLCGANCENPVDLEAALEDLAGALDTTKKVLNVLTDLPDSLKAIRDAENTDGLSDEDKKKMALITGMASTYGGSAAVFVANIMSTNPEDMTAEQKNVDALFAAVQDTDPKSVAIFAAIAMGDVANAPAAVQATANVVSLVQDGSVSTEVTTVLMSLAVGIFDNENNKLSNLNSLLNTAPVGDEKAAAALVDIVSGTSANPVLNIVGSVLSTVQLPPTALSAFAGAFSEGRDSTTSTMTNILTSAVASLNADNANLVAEKMIDGISDDTLRNKVSNALGFAMTD